MTGPAAREEPLPAIPLARLFTLAARSLVDELHVRLAQRGWPHVPPAAGFVLLAARNGPTTGGEIAALIGREEVEAVRRGVTRAVLGVYGGTLPAIGPVA